MNEETLENPEFMMDLKRAFGAVRSECLEGWEGGGVKESSSHLSCCQLCSLPLVELPTVDLDKPKLVTKPVKELRVLDPKSAQNICKCVTQIVLPCHRG